MSINRHVLELLLGCGLFVLVVGGAITPARAHCVAVERGPHSGEHPHCTNEAGPAGGGRYDVTVSGTLSESPPTTYLGRDGNGRSKPVAVEFQRIDLDLSFFFNDLHFGAGRGTACFTDAPGQMRQTVMSISEERDGTALVQYWFWGEAEDGMTEVSYLLEMFGTFSDVMNWRPVGLPNTVMIESWEMSSNKKNTACTGTGSPSGPFLTTDVEVTPTP